MNSPHPIVAIEPLGFPWKTLDPFLFCVYHDDGYPRGNPQMGPDASLTGRDLGQDFSRRDGWSMYHGTTVPGFPAHPHRGFETVTIVRKGLIDHSDSLGAAARFGGGDVQWLTAGRGVVHAEMFPLLDSANPNPLELLQIWLNLPASSKMAPPYFTMFWAESIPRFVATDDAGRQTKVTSIAGNIAASAGEEPAAALAPMPPTTPARTMAPVPPPDSWASQPDADLAICTLHMEPNARWTLPSASGGRTRRSLYFFKGATVRIAGRSVDAHAAIELRADAAVELENGPEVSEFLLLQGRPIAEPVAQYGPFVMNTHAEIAQAMADYRSTGFGRWPWPDPAPVHERSESRFARYPDGRKEKPASAG